MDEYLPHCGHENALPSTKDPYTLLYSRAADSAVWLAGYFSTSDIMKGEQNPSPTFTKKKGHRNVLLPMRDF